MKKFLSRTILFILPVVLFFCVADWWMTKRFRQFDKGNYSVWNDLLDGKVNAGIVIYGSSRADVHFNPKVLEDSFGVNAYNLGINGHNFFMEYLRHKLLLKYNRRPDLIILSVDNVMLDKRENLYDMEQFAPYFSDDDIVAAIKTYEGYSSFDHILPFVRYMPLRRPISHLRAGTFSSTGASQWYKGFHPHDGEWNDDFEIAVSERKKYFQRFDTATIRLFDQFLTETKSIGIPVVFVYTPEYIEGQKFVSNREEVFAHFRFFSNKYNIPFYDYSTDTLCLSKKYFFNSQHLNAYGADIFIKKLVKDIRPLLQKELLPAEGNSK